jgi:hypothetical protein
MRSQKKFRRSPRTSATNRNIIHNLVNKVQITDMLINREPKYQCRILTEENFDEARAQLNNCTGSVSNASHKNESIKTGPKNWYKIT